MNMMNPFDPELLEAVMLARQANPGMFLSFWEMDEQGVDEESEEEIQKDPKKKILWAAENDKIDIVKALLEENKSLVTSRDNDGYTPLHRASYNGHTEMVQLLLANGANIHARTEDGWHPLHSAARWNQAEVVTILLQNAADINSQTNGGLTPLHLAASERDSFETLSVLLSHGGVNIDIKNSIGDTAEVICMRTSENYALFKQFREKLANEGETSKCVVVHEEEFCKLDEAMTTESNITESHKCDENVLSHVISSQEEDRLSHQTVDELESSCHSLALNADSSFEKEDSSVSMETDNVRSGFDKDLESNGTYTEIDHVGEQDMVNQTQVVDNGQCVDMAEDNTSVLQ